MKKLFLLLTLILSISAVAQYKALKGLTYNANYIKYKENDAYVKVESNQIFNISFKDMILVHNDIDSKSSQIYKIIKSSSSYNEEKGRTSYTIDALSGTSGSIYSYVIDVWDDGTVEIFFVSDSNIYLLIGDVYNLTTYIQ